MALKSIYWRFFWKETYIHSKQYVKTIGNRKESICLQLIGQVSKQPKRCRSAMLTCFRSSISKTLNNRWRYSQNSFHIWQQLYHNQSGFSRFSLIHLLTSEVGNWPLLFGHIKHPYLFPILFEATRNLEVKCHWKLKSNRK